MYGLPDQYDLIELPMGKGHVPVPIARRLVGQAVLDAIPRSHKKRDNFFFYCPECDQRKGWQKEVPWLAIIGVPSGYSFLRCKVHQAQTEEYYRFKEQMMVRLVLDGLYKTLRYVETKL
jgi:hypothetical protein